MKYWLLVSCGEAFGIGYELTLKTLKLIKKYKHFLPIVIGSKKLLKYTANKFGISFYPIVMSENSLCNINEISLPDKHCIVVDVKLEDVSRYSVINRSGEVSFSTLEKLVFIIKKFLEKQKKFVVLTMPVSKVNISKFYSNFVGHTEYFAEKFDVAKQKIAMLMEGKDKEENIYRVIMLTRHVPLKDVSKNISIDTVVSQVVNVVEFIDKYEKNKISQILVCNLNPHGGEDGYLSEEETTILKEAVKIIRKKIHKKVVFPLQAADAFVCSRNKKDVLIVTTYHDQAMVPLKLLCRYNIVNITVGLPFLRVSPGHGTANDIYLQNKADISAVKFCLDKLTEFLNNVKN